MFGDDGVDGLLGLLHRQRTPPRDLVGQRSIDALQGVSIV
jgi:hypothetical protein